MVPDEQRQPLSFDQLEPLVRALEEMCARGQGFYASLGEVRDQPNLLDGSTIIRAIAIYTFQQDEVARYQELFTEWQRLCRSKTESQAIVRLSAQLNQYQMVVHGILDVLRALKLGSMGQG